MKFAEQGNDCCRGLRSQLADTETHLDTAKKAAAHAQSQRAAAQEKAARASEDAARASRAADEAAAAAAGQAAQARAAQAAQPKTTVVQEVVEEEEEEDHGLLNAPVQVCAACPHMFLMLCHYFPGFSCQNGRQACLMAHKRADQHQDIFGGPVVMYKRSWLGRKARQSP